MEAKIRDQIAFLECNLKKQVGEYGKGRKREATIQWESQAWETLELSCVRSSVKNMPPSCFSCVIRSWNTSTNSFIISRHLCFGTTTHWLSQPASRRSEHSYCLRSLCAWRKKPMAHTRILRVEIYRKDINSVCYTGKTRKEKGKVREQSRESFYLARARTWMGRVSEQR